MKTTSSLTETEMERLIKEWDYCVQLCQADDNCVQQFKAGNRDPELPLITQEIRKRSDEQSWVRQYMDVQVLAEGEEPVYPIPTDFTDAMWTLPGIRYVAVDFSEPMGDKFYPNLFTIKAGSRAPVEGFITPEAMLEEFIQQVVDCLVELETEAFWRTVMPIATSSCQVASRPANVFNLLPQEIPFL